MNLDVIGLKLQSCLVEPELKHRSLEPYLLHTFCCLLLNYSWEQRLEMGGAALCKNIAGPGHF